MSIEIFNKCKHNIYKNIYKIISNTALIYGI